MLTEAFALMEVFHESQVRKASIVENVPYISHPIAVAGIVFTASGDEKIAAAALLHDVIENSTKTSIKERIMAIDS